MKAVMTTRSKDATEELHEIIQRNARRRVEALAKARTEATARGKEPFDLEALERRCDTSSEGRMDPDDVRRERFEYMYYVEYPSIVTIAELARLIEQTNKW
jgi:hypothetical protein